jgi:hypothetical protein
MSVIEFPNAGPRRRALRRARAQNGQSMHTLLFRSRDLILKSDEADLVRDVCLDVDKAEKKLKAIRRRLQGVQEYAAAQVALLTAADTKLTAAIIVALLSAPSTPDTGRRCELMDILDGGGKERGQRQRKRSRPGSPRPSPLTARSGRSAHGAERPRLREAGTACRSTLDRSRPRPVRLRCAPGRGKDGKACGGLLRPKLQSVAIQLSDHRPAASPDGRLFHAKPR